MTLFFCLFNLVYIPAALWAMEMPAAPGWGHVFQGFYRPNLPGRVQQRILFIILANIGTTITPWQIFFQQSAVVDKGLDIHDIKFGKLDTFVGSMFTSLIAVVHHHHDRGGLLLSPPADHDRRRQADGRGAGAAAAGRRGRCWRAGCSPSACSTRVPRRPLHFAVDLVGRGRGVRLGPLAQHAHQGRALVLPALPGHARSPRAPSC